jgi:hypothetical protein
VSRAYFGNRDAAGRPRRPSSQATNRIRKARSAQSAPPSIHPRPRRLKRPSRPRRAGRRAQNLAEDADAAVANNGTSEAGRQVLSPRASSRPNAGLRLTWPARRHCQAAHSAGLLSGCLAAIELAAQAAAGWPRTSSRAAGGRAAGLLLSRRGAAVELGAAGGRGPRAWLHSEPRPRRRAARLARPRLASTPAADRLVQSPASPTCPGRHLLRLVQSSRSPLSAASSKPSFLASNPP